MAATANINTGPRRSATLPTTLQRPGGDASTVDPRAETLFAHPSGKIVCFAAPNVRSGSSTGGIASPKGIEALPWKRSNERVVAVGLLRIYRVPGSVSFIASGDLLLSLLPRSQCWCVDGESKFAMFIKGMIYRIELPFETEHDKGLVEEMKEALGKVLKYEKTTCPFSRGFDVDGAEEPNSPIPLGPKWSHIKERKRESADAEYLQVNDGTSKTTTDGSSPDVSDEDGSMSTITEETVNPKQTSTGGKKEDDTKPPIRPRVKDAIRAFSSPLDTIVSSDRSSQPLTKDNVERQDLQSQQQSSNLTLDAIQATPVSHTSLSSHSPISPVAPVAQLENERHRPRHILGRVSDDPFVDHNFQDPSSHLSTDEEISDVTSDSTTDRIDLARGKVDVSESTFTEVTSEAELPTVAAADTNIATQQLGMEMPSQVTIDNTPSQQNNSDLAEHHASGVTSSSDEPPSQLREQELSATPVTERHTRSRHSSSSLGSPISPPPREFSVGIISRTAAILMGPPSGLIQIMMQIASRIARGADAAGAYRFRLGPGTPSGKRVHLGRRYSNHPGRWQDSEDDGEESASSVTGSEARSLEEDEWSENYSDEDDYGVALGNDAAGRARRRKWSASEQGDWEID